MKKLIIGLVIFVFVFTILGAQNGEYKQIRRFGVAPLKKDGVYNDKELLELLNQEQEAVIVALGRNDALVKLFLQQMFKMDIQRRDFEKGSKFLSMTYRWGGKILDTGRWEWAGDKPFRAFVLVIEQKIGGAATYYSLVVPERCGNICLEKIDYAFEGGAVSSWPGIPGSIPEPNVVASEPKIEEPKPRPKYVPLRPVPEFKSRFESTQYAKYFMDMALGGFRGCYQEYAVARTGLRHKLGSRAEFVLLLGVGLPLEWENDEWNIVPILDINLNYRFSFFTMGIGAGASGKVKDNKKDQFEGIISFGVQPEKNMDIFFEGRMPISRQFGLQDDHKIILGLRMFF